MLSACAQAMLPPVASWPKHSRVPTMCDIVALVAVGGGTRPRTGPGDVSDISDIVSLVQQAKQKSFTQRSWESTLHARLHRKLKQTAGQRMNLETRALFQIRLHNAEVAIRTTDEIQTRAVSDVSPLRKGRGSHRRWLPNAVLRCCFGNSRGPASATGLHAAARTVAQWMRGSHTHVQRVRNCVAETVLSTFEQGLTSAVAAAAPFVVLQVSFDETKEDLRCENTTGTHHVLMCQAYLAMQTQEGWTERPIVCPTTVIASTSAEHILSALLHRLPFMLDFCDSSRYVMILNSDSAKSNIRLARHMEALTERKPFAVLHSRCQMHMACAGIVMELKYLDLTSSAFCATLQLHDGARVRSLRDVTREYVRSKLRLVFQEDESFEGNRSLHEKIMNLIVSQSDDPDVPPGCQTKRRNAARELVKLLPGDWSSSEIVHFCPLGCCDSPDSAADKIASAIDDLLLSRRPCVPSLNRWTRLQKNKFCLVNVL